jgi:general secretion pathway protein D
LREPVRQSLLPVFRSRCARVLALALSFHQFASSAGAFKPERPLSAAKLYSRGEKLEKKGDIINAYLAYSQAAAADPENPKYWAKSQALRTRAAMQAKVMPPERGRLGEESGFVAQEDLVGLGQDTAGRDGLATPERGAGLEVGGAFEPLAAQSGGEAKGQAHSPEPGSARPTVSAVARGSLAGQLADAQEASSPSKAARSDAGESDGRQAIVMPELPPDSLASQYLAAHNENRQNNSSGKLPSGLAQEEPANRLPENSLAAEWMAAQRTNRQEASSGANSAAARREQDSTGAADGTPASAVRGSDHERIAQELPSDSFAAAFLEQQRAQEHGAKAASANSGGGGKENTELQVNKDTQKESAQAGSPETGAVRNSVVSGLPAESFAAQFLAAQSGTATNPPPSPSPGAHVANPERVESVAVPASASGQAATAVPASPVASRDAASLLAQAARPPMAGAQNPSTAVSQGSGSSGTQGAPVSSHSDEDPPREPYLDRASAYTKPPNPLSPERTEEDEMRLQPPVELKPERGEPRDFDLSGDAKRLWGEVLKAYKVDVVFDGDYQPLSNLRFRVQGVTFEEAVVALMAATNSFFTPVSDRMVLVARDTQQKRTEVEGTAVIAVPIPDPVTTQEATELALAVQQSLDIQKHSINFAQRLVLFKDRVSKLGAAVQLFRQLAGGRAEVQIEIEFLTFVKNSTINFGFPSPTSLALAYLRGRSLPLNSVGSFASLFGVAIGGTQLIAEQNYSTIDSIFRTNVRTSDSQQATFHVGDRYPILTQGFFGLPADSPPLPSSFTFEDLGLVLKLQTKVHDTEELTVALEAELKTLAGTGTNNIPIIANRRFTEQVRLRFDQSIVISGLLSDRQIRTIAGLAGFLNVPVLGPLFSRNTRTSEQGETLVVLKPRLVRLPPGSLNVTKGIWTGSETRPRPAF